MENDELPAEELRAKGAGTVIGLFLFSSKRRSDGLVVLLLMMGTVLDMQCNAVLLKCLVLYGRERESLSSRLSKILLKIVFFKSSLYIIFICNIEA